MLVALETDRAVAAVVLETTQLEALLALTTIRLGSPWVRSKVSMEDPPVISLSSQPMLALKRRGWIGFQMDSSSMPFTLASMFSLIEVRLTIFDTW